jgi:plasmid stabilization system protein ParE
MNPVRKLPKAEQDLIEIWLRIAQDRPVHADWFLDFLDEKMHLLASSPRMARLRPELGNELRSFPVDHYTIFFREAGQLIEIVRVLHGARDVATLFSTEPPQ